MKSGRPRKLGIWSAKLLKLYRYLGYDMDTLTKRFNISKRTVYRYIGKGDYNVNVNNGLRKNSKGGKKT